MTPSTIWLRKTSMDQQVASKFIEYVNTLVTHQNIKLILEWQKYINIIAVVSEL